MEEVILVDIFDNAIGRMEKLEAHQKGVLHRAFSVFIFNDNNELLLQRRALSKYHSAGLWTNTCCSHPRPGEETLEAANRRLKEEMGMEVDLDFKTSFTYKTEFENGLTEHEFDYVYFGNSNNAPVINTEEVAEFIWLGIDEIKERIKLSPNEFTSWFKIAIEKLF
ncbi:MAG: isopentenyl-diphosphate Delta-isomerase [Bacteroidota bacterium]|nr:isopentenyl-diphosphate Delta-isomerase [Bacteroidota bacterium]